MTKKEANPSRGRGQGRHREPSQERSIRTRAKLLAASIACIHQYGYTGTTTAKICRKAGVTRGALQHHFGEQKVDLMAAVAEQLYDNMLERYKALLKRADEASRTDAMRAAFEELASSYDSPELMALLEIWMATRGDKDLAKTVLPTIQKIDEPADELWNRLFGREAHCDIYRVIGRAIRWGLAIETIIHGNTESLRQAAFLLGELIVREVDRGYRQTSGASPATKRVAAKAV